MRIGLPDRLPKRPSLSRLRDHPKHGIGLLNPTTATRQFLLRPLDPLGREVESKKTCDGRREGLSKLQRDKYPCYDPDIISKKNGKMKKSDAGIAQW